MPHRGFALISADHRVCGRFHSRRGAEDEYNRLFVLAAKRGERFTARIVWEPPMPRDEQEAGEFSRDEKLY